VARGDAVVAPRVTCKLLERFAGQLSVGPEDSAPDPRLSSLTDREREVFIEMAKGLSNAEIAERLYLSEAMVKTHVGRILPSSASATESRPSCSPTRPGSSRPVVSDAAAPGRQPVSPRHRGRRIR
jgi:hypothetical protein